MSLCADVIVKSSAHENIYMLASVGRVSCMQMLKSVGDRTEAWGIPFWKFRKFDGLQLNDTYDCLYSLSASLCQAMGKKRSCVDW